MIDWTKPVRTKSGDPVEITEISYGNFPWQEIEHVKGVVLHVRHDAGDVGCASVRWHTDGTRILPEKTFQVHDWDLENVPEPMPKLITGTIHVRQSDVTCKGKDVYTAHVAIAVTDDILEVLADAGYDISEVE